MIHLVLQNNSSCNTCGERYLLTMLINSTFLGFTSGNRFCLEEPKPCLLRQWFQFHFILPSLSCADSPFLYPPAGRRYRLHCDYQWRNDVMPLLKSMRNRRFLREKAELTGIKKCRFCFFNIQKISLSPEDPIATGTLSAILDF